jgi:hypothetical protein
LINLERFMEKTPSPFATPAAPITAKLTGVSKAPTSALAHILDPDNPNSPPSAKSNDAASGNSIRDTSSFSYPKHPDRMQPAAAAAYLGVKESTLAVWRSTKRYPLPFIKVGRLIYYSTRAIDAFLVSRTINPEK